MRPTHNTNNNKQRMRGRPQNNRRGPNPLTRSYESNGPDVKIRGNAHHVAEKYLQLARDAHTGGDPVSAENYLQHAEHYFRMIATAQAAQALALSGRPPGEGESEDGEDDDDFGGMSDRFASPQERQAPAAANGQQPGFAPAPAVPALAPQPSFDAKPQGEPQQPRENYGQRGNFRQDRGQRQDRPNNGQDYRGNREQKPREFRIFRDYQPRVEPPAPQEAEAPGLPSFITAAPRLPAAEEFSEPPQANVDERAGAVEAPNAETGSESEAPQTRGRRRRLRSPYGLLRQGEGDQESGDGGPNQE